MVTGQGQMFPKKLFHISDAICLTVQASYLESMYNTIRGFIDSVQMVKITGQGQMFQKL